MKIKIRYALKNKNTNQIHFKWYTISQIEEKGLSKLFDIENYEILGRDLKTGWVDRNNKDIYNNDIVLSMRTKSKGSHELLVVGSVRIQCKKQPKK